MFYISFQSTLGLSLTFSTNFPAPASRKTACFSPEKTIQSIQNDC